MNYIEQIFEKATIKGIADYLLYHEKPIGEEKDYETSLDNAFEAFEKVALTYDQNRESELINAMNKFAGTLTDIYTEIGLQAGFLIMLDMMKNTDCNKAKDDKETQVDIYQKMYESISFDVSAALTILQEKGREAVDEAEFILKESQQKAEKIYLDSQKRGDKYDKEIYI